MGMLIIGTVIIGIFGVFYFVFTWKAKPKEAVRTVANTAKSNNTKVPDVQRKDVFNFIEFEKISDDMIVQDKETKYSMVLQCKGINYDLMSEIEQIAVEEGFITFLNTLKSPIQIYVQARAIDLRTSLNMYKTRVDGINLQYKDAVSNYNKIATSLNTNEQDMKLAKSNMEKFQNISEYAQDITRYVERLSLNKHMLQRKFYIVVSYFRSEITSTANFSKQEIQDICYRELYTRAQSISSALQACSVNSKVLNSNELAELLYISFNRDDEKLIDIQTALDSGFYRLYSTSKDVVEKKREYLQQEIDKEATSRVEEAIKAAIAAGIIKSQDEVMEELETQADVQAVRILEESDIPQKEKKQVQQLIIDAHNENVEKRTQEKEKKVEKEQLEEKTDEEIIRSKKTDEENDSIIGGQENV